MARRTLQRWVAWAGVALGLSLVMGAVVVVWRVPAGTALSGAAIDFSVSRTGALAVDRTGTFMRARGLTPSDEATGYFVITNESGTALAIRLRGRRDVRDLDRVLHIGVRAGQQDVFAGWLGQLDRWTDSFLIEPGESQQLEIRVWLPYSSGVAASAGRESSVQLDLASEPVDG